MFGSPVTWSTTTAQSVTQAFATYAIDNQSTGSIIFNSTLAFVGSVATAAGASVTTAVTANNGAAGTLTLGAITDAATANSGGFTHSVVLSVAGAAGGTLNLAGGAILGNVNSGGTLAITGALAISGNLTNAAATISAALTVTGNMTSSGASTVSGVLTVTGNLTNSAAMTLQSNASVAGVLTNSSTIALGANTLTLSGAVAHLTNGGTISGTGTVVASKAGASFNGGTFPALSITGSTVTVAGTATVASLSVSGALAISDGVTLTSNGLVTETGNITLGAGASGILALKGDFNRTSGTWTAGVGSTLLVNGTVAQNLNGGPLFQVVNLTFSNTTGVVTLGASMRASGIVTINANVSVALNTLNIILNSNTASMINSGSYSASGGGGVILGGTNTVVGGVAATSITIGGAGTYSYITVDVGANAATLSTNVKFTGVLTLRSGSLATSTFDLSPNGSAASIVRYVISSPGLNTTGGTFDAANVDYDLTYTETLSGNTTVTAGASEFATANIHNLTISTPPAAAQTLTLTSAGAITVKGDMVVSQNVLFVLDNVTPYNVTLKGNLTVNTGAVVSGGSAANTVTLSGDAKTFSVIGTVSAADVFVVTGNGSSLTGSTVTADAASINNLAFEPTANGASFTSANLKSITAGPLTVQGTSTATGASATITMNATNASLTGNVAIGSGTVTPTVALTINGATTSVLTGNVTVTTGTLTLTRGGNSTTNTGNIVIGASGTLVLGSNLTVTGTNGQTGNLNLASFNLTQMGAYTHAGTGTVTGTGIFIVASTAAAQPFTLTTAVTIPNVTLQASAAGNGIQLATADLTVSGALKLVMGTLDFNGRKVLFTGSTITTAVGTAGDVTLSSATGTLNLGNATGGSIAWTSNDDVTLPGTVIVNSTGTVTFASDKESTPTARKLNILNLTITAGNLVTGINNVTITGAFDRSASTAGTWTQTTGYLVFNTAAAFKPGSGFAIDNLEIDQSVASNTPASDVMTVNKNLRLVSGTLTMNAGLLTLGSGVVVERQADGAMLSAVPTFAGTMSVTYTTGAGGVTTVANFNELPVSVTNFSVITPQAVTLPKNVTVTGSLTLSGVLTTTTAKNITMANGATLVLKANGGTVLPGTNLVLAGSINIVYDGATSVSTRELGAVASGAYTTVTGNVTFKSGTVVLDNDLTVGGTATFSGGTFDIGGKNVVFDGDVIQTAAGFVINNTTGSANVTFGGASYSVNFKEHLGSASNWRPWSPVQH